MPDPIQMNQVGKKLKQEVQQQSGDIVVKSKDTNPPQLPQIVRAFCFEHITDPSTHVHPNPPPAPPPNPPYRRDPFLLELGNIELGSKIQLISLSDDPNGSFEKGNVFELSFTGYDSNSRRGTVLLSAEEMEKKAIQPGERLVVRVVDDNGQASDGVFVHVDPQRWAGNGRIDTKNEAGAAVTLTGAQVAFTDGFVKPGEDASTKTKTTWGATIEDKSAPQLLADNVEVKTFNWNKTEAEMFTSIGQHGQFFVGSTAEQGGAWCATPGNLDTIPIEHRASVAAMGADGGKLLFKMLMSQFPDKRFEELKQIPITQQMFQQMGQVALNAVTNGGGRETMVVFKNALEPGTKLTVTNNSSGQALNGAQNDTQRSNVVRIALKEGDKVTVQFTDGNNVRGEPYAFEYAQDSKNGKTGEKGGSFKNPLNMQLAARTVKLNGE